MKWEPRSEYAKKLKDPQWQMKRLEILQRDQYQCQSCGDCRSSLQVHHVAYCPWERTDPWDEPSGLLVTLCEICHETEHASIREATYLILGMFGEAGIRTARDLTRVAELYFYPSSDGEVEDESFHAQCISRHLAKFHRYKREDISEQMWFRDL